MDRYLPRSCHPCRNQSGIGKLSVQVQTRVARASYGICWNEPWNSQHHNHEEKYFCDIEQQYYARNQMAWLLEEVSMVHKK